MTIKVSNNNIVAPEAQIEQLMGEIHSLRLDSLLVNLATKIGSNNHDKRLANRIKPVIRLSLEEIDNLFEGSPYAAKLIEGLPALCTRKTPIYSVGKKDEDNEDRDAEITTAMQKLIEDALVHFREAYSLARKYGGSAIVLGANDGETDLTKPLNVNKLKTLSDLFSFSRNLLRLLVS
mgnify:FL=1